MFGESSFFSRTTRNATVVAVEDSALIEIDQALYESVMRDNPQAASLLARYYKERIVDRILATSPTFGLLTAAERKELLAKMTLRSFEPGRGTRLGTWLGLLANHAAYDFLRSARRAPRLDELSGAESVCTDLPDPSEATLLRERARLLSEALSELSDKDREFVDLYYGRGLSPEEVATRMGIQVKTVYTKKHKLQGRLQSLLGAQLLAA